MMGPQKTVVPVSFSGGLDTKTDPKQVIPGKLLDLQNGIFLKTGGINRRWGYTALGKSIVGSAATIASAKAIEGGFNQELLLYDGTLAYSYIPATNAWAPRGGMVSVIQTNQQIVRNSSQQLSPDVGVLGGIEVYAWEDSRGGIRYSVVDQASSALLVVDQPLYVGMPSTLYRPKVVALPVQGLLVVFYVTSDGSIGYVPLNPSNPTAPTVPVVVLSSQGASGPGVGVFYDVAAHPNGRTYLLYSTIQGTSALISWLRLEGTPLAATRFQHTGADSPSAIMGALAVTVDAAGNIWMVWPNNVAGTWLLWLLALNSAEGTLFGQNQIFTASTSAIVGSTVAVTASLATVLIETAAAVSFNELIVRQTVTAGGLQGFPTAALPVFARSVGLASKAFQYLGAIYVNVAYQSPLQSTYFTLDQNGAVVAKQNAQLGGGLTASNDFVLSEVPQAAPGIFLYANLVKGIVNTEAGAVQSLLGVNATTLDFIDSNHFLGAAIAGGLYTVGGILQSYDGAQYVEHGFHIYPEGVVLAPAITGGSMAAGTYGYAVTYEWVDNAGNAQLSTPSVVHTTVIASGTTGSVQLTIPTLRLTKKTKVKVVVYRTTQGPGQILYRVTSALVPLYNDPTVDTVTFTDTLADASITSNGAMYTQPLTVGANPVLPNSAPPACSLITTYSNRLWINDSSDPFGLWYSQAALQGSPMQFSALLRFRSDPDGGPITAIARMDDKLVVFKANAIFYLFGQGPTATGDQNDLGVPISIPSGEVGCVSQNSIVMTPIGLLFQSLNGIYLLDRGLNVSYKGAPVENFNSLTITSSTLIPNQWVVFTTTSGLALVYDYYYDQWSTFTNHVSVDSDLYLGANNVFVWAKTDGTVYQQTPTTCTDNGAAIPFSLTTAWITLAQLQGYQRVYHALLLGTYKGSHNLNVWCGFDYDDQFVALAPIPVDATLGTATFGSSTPFGIDATFGGASGQSVYQFRVDVLRKCQAIRFQITDQESAPGNEGFSLSAISLVVGVKRGQFRLPATKQFGAG